MTLDLALAAHNATLRAVQRFRDPGLALRVLADERRRWARVQAAERQRQADALASLVRPWRDELGYLHCPACGHYADRSAPGPSCTCPIRIRSEGAA